MTVYSDVVKVVVGSSTISDIAEYSWNTVFSEGDSSAAPVYVMGSIQPIALRATHKYYSGYFSPMSDVGSALDAYIGVPSTIVATVVDTTGSSTFGETFTTAYLAEGQTLLKEGQNPTKQFKFSATTYTHG